MEVTLLKEQNEELVKNVSDMNVNISDIHETVSALKKEVEILKDELGQSQIPVTGGGVRTASIHKTFRITLNPFSTVKSSVINH